MTQLMESLFERPFKEESATGKSPVAQRIEAIEGNYGRLAAHDRLPEDEIQLRDEKIHVCYAENPNRIGRHVLAELPQDRRREILPAAGIICEIEVPDRPAQFAGTPQSFLQGCHELFDDAGFSSSQANQIDRALSYQRCRPPLS